MASGLAVVGAACLPTKPPPPPTQAQLQITPASESFTDDFPDPGAQTKQFTVTNVGGETSGALQSPVVTGASEFSLASPDTCGGGSVTLAPGASCSISVQFTASAASGTVTGQMSVSASPGGEATAELSGTMTPPPTVAQLQITPATESFTDDFPDPGAQTKQFTVTNVGGQTSGALEGPVVVMASEFSVASPGSCGAGSVTLAPGASCTFSVQFTASAASGDVIGVVSVVANPGGDPAAVLNGTMTPTAVPAIDVSPATVVLLAPGAQTDSPPVEIFIQNNGAGAATNVQLVVSTTSGEGIQEVSRTCGANGSTLAAATGCSITVKWSPNLTITAQGHLSVTGDNFQTVIVPIAASLD